MNYDNRSRAIQKIIPKNKFSKILLVEGDLADARSLELVIKHRYLASFSIITVSCIKETYELLRKGERFEVILLELQVLDSCQFETLEKIKIEFPESNILLITELNDKSVGLEAIEIGVQDVIIKRILDTDDLTRTLQYAIICNKVIKRLEETQKIAIESEIEMVKSQKRYREIFTQSKDAIYISTLDGHLVDFNQSTEYLFGRSRAELSCLDIHCLYYSIEKRNEFLLKLTKLKTIKDYRIDILRKNGEVRNCLVTANILHSEGASYNCIIRDITENIQAEQLKKARSLANHAAKMKEQLIASISHEMRTPMNAILGMSNILVQTALDEEQSKLVSSIKQSSEILLGIVNDILEISSIQNKKIVFNSNDFELRELMNNLMDVMHYKAQEKDLYFEVFIDQNVPNIIRCDKLRLNQVLLNLIGNAIKFTETGYVKVYVRLLHRSVEGVQLEFIIEDSGIGIPPDKIDVIFETFTRIKNIEKIYEGTGLGLSICKNIVEQQGGKIGVISDLGHGSRFFFDLIVERGDLTKIERNIPAETIEFDDETAFKLLLVEDHKMNQLVAKKTLLKKWKNIELKIADNGKEAIKVLQEDSFDLVLMDIQMPIMDGKETTLYIRKEMPELKNLPILAMTAHAQIAKNDNYKKYGMDGYVLKPFRPEELFFKIVKHLSHSLVMTKQ